jgi:eukaryotic-like serine/threonine-protein kinase
MRSTGIDAIWAGAIASAPIRLVYREGPARPDEQARRGLVVAQRYELDYPLGASTPGSLWHARDLRRGQAITLQLLDPAIAEDAELLATFFGEVRAAAAIVHPNVAQIIDSGVDAGAPFLVLDRLDGDSLARRLHTRGRLSPAEVAQLFADVALGLEALHGRGLVHRRLDPAHLFLMRDTLKSGPAPRRGSDSSSDSSSDTGSENTKVLFGIDGNLAEGLSLLRQLTEHMSGQAPQDLGWDPQLPLSMSVPTDSTAYQSPELLLGYAPVDHRSDLWSLAVIAFEALTGTRAFEGPSNGERLIQICSGSPSQVPASVQLPAGFAPWFRKGVSRLPSGRFGSVREMADSLLEILDS